MIVPEPPAFADPRLGNRCGTLIRHDFKRGLYRALLSELPAADVRDFFLCVPLVLGGEPVRGREVFRLLWREKAEIPVWWDVATDNILEDWLLSKGRDPARVIERVLWLNNRSTHMPGKVVLTWFHPKLEALFSAVDTRDLCVSLITLFNENWIPGLRHPRVRKRAVGDQVESVMAFILDPEFKEFLDWDLELFGAPQVLRAPGMLGLPHFESFRMLADTRPPERVIREARDLTGREDGILRIRGQEYGRIEPFSAFCRRAGIDLSKYAPPDVPVVAMARDYACPHRRRVVLHAGCAYGAPLFLHTLTHTRLRTALRWGVGPLVEDIAREEGRAHDDLERLHLDLLARVRAGALLEYHAADESMSLDGEHLVKGAPARLLRAILAAHAAEGRTEFTYREFKRDEDVALGPKATNFEVRFYRLEERLRERNGPVRLEKTGRGAFRLALSGEIDFRER